MVLVPVGLVWFDIAGRIGPRVFPAFAVLWLLLSFGRIGPRAFSCLLWYGGLLGFGQWARDLIIELRDTFGFPCFSLWALGKMLLLL